MRYIVVFAQEEADYALGFDDPADAVDFLFWGYEEYDLIPYGIVDAVTGGVFPYEHRGERIIVIDDERISRTAKDYLMAAFRQMM